MLNKYHHLMHDAQAAVQEIVQRDHELADLRRLYTAMLKSSHKYIEAIISLREALSLSLQHSSLDVDDPEDAEILLDLDRTLAQSRGIA